MKKTASQPSPFHAKAFIANDGDGGNRSPLPEFEAIFLKRVDRLDPATAGAIAGWDLHPLESAAFSRRAPKPDIATASCCNCKRQIADTSESCFAFTMHLRGSGLSCRLTLE
jgi:hypothetical protein